MQKLETIYLGIVVQNNDPEYRGRVKVWVPYANATVYNKWNALKEDKSFKFPGTNIESDLSSILEELKDDLPWAEQVSPLVGAVASGVYNSNSDTATVSDAPFQFSLSAVNTSPTLPELQLNLEGIGEKPGFVYQKYGTISATQEEAEEQSSTTTLPVDAFTNTAATYANQLNQYGNSYQPSTYSNAAKGLFAVPNVGAHVWVMFLDGMPSYPIYFGASFGADDFNSIFKTESDAYQDYPQTYENVNKSGPQDITGQTPIYRNKMVLNQRGAAIEIISTTDRERFKVTHFAGGFLELNNKFNSIFSPKNLQLLTLRDKFETINGHNNLFVGRDYDNLIRGNHHIKVGNLDKSAMEEWIAAYTPIAELLALPDTDSAKSTITQAIIDKAAELTAAEVKMGFGGNSIETITKHKIMAVGLLMNTFDSMKITSVNKTVYNKLIVSVDTGVEVASEDIDQVDYAYIADPPGGNYTQSIANKYNILVGSGGYSLYTTGPITTDGGIIKNTGVQVNLASREDFNIDGGTNLSIIADIISIRSRQQQQVLVDDSLGVSKNVIIGGGAYVNGETYVQHITAPDEVQYTEPNFPALISAPNTATIQGYITSVPPTATITQGAFIKISFLPLDKPVPGFNGLTANLEHVHPFHNIPLTLLAEPIYVQEAATALNPVPPE